MADPVKNPVGFLQELCQKHRNAPFAQFVECGSSGPDHCKEFSCRCIYDGHEVVASSHQKKQAKNEAAKRMIDLLKNNNYFSQFSVEILNKSSDKNSHHVSKEYNFTAKNPISALHEYCQQEKLSLPIYIESRMPQETFICECILNDIHTYGNGNNKKTAKTESSLKMCRQLNIAIEEDQFLKTELREGKECLSEKNPISALQEFCASNKSLPDPVYENKPTFMNFFVIVCSVGVISAEGRDITKKGAKFCAANKVLKQLARNKDVIERLQTHGRPKSMQQKVDNSIIDELDSGIDQMSFEEKLKPEPPIRHLEDLDLGSDNEDDDIKFSSDLHNKETLESLNLDDSVVEVEPSSVLIDPKIKIKEEPVTETHHQVEDAVVSS